MGECRQVVGRWGKIMLLTALAAWASHGNEVAEGSGRGAQTGAGNKDSGVIEGIVTFAGTMPKSREADESGYHRDLLTLDSQSKGVEGAVAFLRVNANGSAGAAPLKKPPVVDQVNHTFIPHVLAIPAGSTVRFLNSDPANHNVRASSSNSSNSFNVYVAQGSEYRHKFQPQRNQIPVLLGCDIHPWMRGWVYVFEHPFYAVTDEKGAFRIEGVPPGEYQVRIRQPDVGFREERTVTVKPGETNRMAVEIRSAELKIP